MKKVTFTVRILTIMVQRRGGKLRSRAPDERSKDLKNEALAWARAWFLQFTRNWNCVRIKGRLGGGLGLEVASRGPRSTAKQIEPKAERQSLKPHAV